MVCWRCASVTVHCRSVSGLSAKINVSVPSPGESGANEAELDLRPAGLHAGDRAHRRAELDVIGQQDAQGRLTDWDVGGLVQRLVMKDD